MLTTHVLNTATGEPAVGVAVALSDAAGTTLAEARTNADGRLDAPLPVAETSAIYTLTFQTADYFEAGGESCFYPAVSVHFEITDPTKHHHVPLLISPFGYSTYRGS